MVQICNKFEEKNNQMKFELENLEWKYELLENQAKQYEKEIGTTKLLNNELQ